MIDRSAEADHSSPLFLASARFAARAIGKLMGAVTHTSGVFLGAAFVPPLMHQPMQDRLARTIETGIYPIPFLFSSSCESTSETDGPEKGHPKKRGLGRFRLQNHRVTTKIYAVVYGFG